MGKGIREATRDYSFFSFFRPAFLYGLILFTTFLYIDISIIARQKGSWSQVADFIQKNHVDMIVTQPFGWVVKDYLPTSAPPILVLKPEQTFPKLPQKTSNELEDIIRYNWIYWKMILREIDNMMARIPKEAQKIAYIPLHGQGLSEDLIKGVFERKGFICKTTFRPRLAFEMPRVVVMERSMGIPISPLCYY